jgi:hypothetical protein
MKKQVEGVIEELEGSWWRAEGRWKSVGCRLEGREWNVACERRSYQWEDICRIWKLESHHGRLQLFPSLLRGKETLEKLRVVAQQDFVCFVLFVASFQNYIVEIATQQEGPKPISKK